LYHCDDKKKSVNKFFLNRFLVLVLVLTGIVERTEKCKTFDKQEFPRLLFFLPYACSIYSTV